VMPETHIRETRMRVVRSLPWPLPAVTVIHSSRQRETVPGGVECNKNYLGIFGGGPVRKPGPLALSQNNRGKY
jgi:hypothetical protein